MARRRTAPTKPVIRPEDIVEVEAGQQHDILPVKETQEKILQDPNLAQLADRDISIEEEAATRPFVNVEGVTTTAGEEGVAAQIGAEERFTPIDLDALGNDPEGFRQGVNARLDETRATFKERALNDPEREDRFIQPLDQEMSETILSTGENMVRSLVAETPENVITYSDDGETISYSQMIAETYGNVNPNSLGVAIASASYAVAADPANTALLKFPKETEQGAKDRKKAIKQALASPDEPVTDKTINQLKAEAVAEDNLDSYSHLDAQARAMVGLSREMLGTDPEATDAVNASELGERYQQELINRGDLVLDYYADPNNPQKKIWFTRPTQQARSRTQSGRTITALAAPGRFQLSLPSDTPQSFKGNLGEKPKNKETLQQMNKNDAVIGDQVYLSINQGVGKTPDMFIHGIVNQLSNSQHPLALKYFKLDPENLAATRKKVYENTRGRLIRSGMTEAEADQRAQRRADEEINIYTRQETSKNRAELDALPEYADQTKFAEWDFGANHRAQMTTRWMQNEHKATTRAVWNFTERARIRKKSTAEMKSKAQRNVNTLKNIMFQEKHTTRMRDGFDAMQNWNSLDQQTQWEINQAIVWTRAYIDLWGRGEPYVDVDGKERNVNPKRMMPHDMLHFYATNFDSIMGQLSQLGTEIADWDTQINLDHPMAEKLIARGELPYRIRAATDAANFMTAENDAYVTMEARTEPDQSNSNVFIHALKTGHKGATSTLGFDIDPVDPDAWHTNPDSFYTILGDNMYAAVETMIADDDMAKAWGTFLDGIQTNPGNTKDNTRSLLVEGFYGLHPIVNTNGTKKVLSQFVNQHQELLTHYGGDEQALINDFNRIRGYTYDTTLGKVSATKLMKNGMALRTIGGDTAFQYTTDTGAVLNFGVAESTPEYLDGDMFAMSADGRYEAAPRLVTYKDADGVDVPSLARRQRIDYRNSKYSLDKEGEIVDLSKDAGLAIGDSMSAIVTHATDAALMKTAVLAQNMGRETSAPNDPIHDANQLNGVSYMGHWIGYHMIGIPAMAKSDTTYSGMYDETIKHKKTLEDTIQRTSGPVIDFGTESDFRTVFAIFDYHAKYNTDDVDAEADAGVKAWREKRAKEVASILAEAERYGYLPPESVSNSERRHVAVKKGDALRSHRPSLPTSRVRTH